MVEFQHDEVLECEIDSKSTMPAHLGSFILSNSKKIMNDFLPEPGGLKTNKMYYFWWR